MLKHKMYAGRLPTLSEKPAMSIGATPCQMRYVVTVKLIFDADTPRSLEIVVKAGKYIEPVKGEKNAAKLPAAIMHRFCLTVKEEYAG